MKEKQMYLISIMVLSSDDDIQEIGSFSNLWLWHVDLNENTLLTFEIDWNTHPPEVQHTKWTITGQLLERKDFRLSLPGGRPVDKRELYSPLFEKQCIFGNRTIKNETP